MLSVDNSIWTEVQYIDDINDKVVDKAVEVNSSIIITFKDKSYIVIEGFDHEGGSAYLQLGSRLTEYELAEVGLDLGLITEADLAKHAVDEEAKKSNRTLSKLAQDAQTYLSLKEQFSHLTTPQVIALRGGDFSVLNE